MTQTDSMFYECFPLFKEGYDVGKSDGMDKMANEILNMIHERSHFGKCEISIDDVMSILNENNS